MYKRGFNNEPTDLLCGVMFQIIFLIDLSILNVLIYIIDFFPCRHFTLL